MASTSLAFAAALALGGCSDESEEPTVSLEQAYEDCGGASLSDEGITLSQDGESIVGEPVLNIEAAKAMRLCLMWELQSSEALKAQMGSTTQSMGRQTKVDGDFTWTWSFSDGRGTSYTIEE